MAGRPGPPPVEPAGTVGRAEEAGGQAKSSQKIEDLMEMVKKLQKAGSLEPRVEVLINRINEVQQAKKKASEELGEARTVWETLQKELDSLSGEKAHLKEILSKKQETLRILRLHCQEKESEAQRLDFEEQLEDLMGQHKDLWEFHKPERLALEIGALDSSKEQLLKEEKLVEAKLEDVKHRLCSQFGAKGCSTITEGLFLRSQEAAAVVHLFEEENKKAQELLEAAAQRQEQLQQKCQQLQQKRQRLKEELQKLGVQVPAQAQSKQEEGAGPGEAVSPGIWCREQRQLMKGAVGGKARRGSADSSEESLQGRAFPKGYSQGKGAEAGSGGMRRGRTQRGSGHRDVRRLPPQTLTLCRPIPSPLESLRRKTQSCPPSRA
ncbi:synaptonemal complex central element protein 1 isoform X2 [Hippopotamus amphibius kiboko]|uniref:synaptonemal complex central element protein 1 isoform X2 n=1 Tax=Hippopotamus amphibius kiboko TaxID=575201 RepID=UPI00259A5678|nr:synaptonemal complex central element protein 1 isoform X2 [Hippopotamus amphibius kiboko]